VKVVHNLKEACELVEAGFEYVTDMEGAKIFRKRNSKNSRRLALMIYISRHHIEMDSRALRKRIQSKHTRDSTEFF